MTTKLWQTKLTGTIRGVYVVKLIKTFYIYLLYLGNLVLIFLPVVGDWTRGDTILSKILSLLRDNRWSDFLVAIFFPLKEAICWFDRPLTLFLFLFQIIKIEIVKNWRAKKNTQHVSLSQITEEKGRGKGLEPVWSDENGWNEKVVWKTEIKGQGGWKSSCPLISPKSNIKVGGVEETYKNASFPHRSERKKMISLTGVRGKNVTLVCLFVPEWKKSRVEGTKCHTETMMHWKADKAWNIAYIMCRLVKRYKQKGM